MSEMLCIRPATPADVPEILAFIRELAAYERLEREVSASEHDLHEALFGEPIRAEVVLACLVGQPVGFALYFHTFSTFKGRPGLYLEDLYVQAQVRGRGIGRSLLAHLAQTALNRRCARLEWSVLDWNAPSIGFYRRLGAKPMEDWTVFRLAGEPLEQLARKPPQPD